VTEREQDPTAGSVLDDARGVEAVVGQRLRSVDVEGADE